MRGGVDQALLRELEGRINRSRRIRRRPQVRWSDRSWLRLFKVAPLVEASNRLLPVAIRGERWRNGSCLGPGSREECT